MSTNSAIEWTNHTWNPWHGCHKVSPGCKFCYMFREKKQYGQDPNVVVRSKTKFNDPLKWKDPAFVFTCSWSDWFIEEADTWRDEAYDIIRRTPHLTYQILTKRPERIAGRWPDPPPPNAWLGVSVEDNDHTSRIAHLLQIPAALRFVSAEPLLAPLDLESGRGYLTGESHDNAPYKGKRVDWVIVGGESGPGARSCNLAWIRSIRDQCAASGVPCFIKQLGLYPVSDIGPMGWPLKDRKGGDPEEWPADLRVREMPNVRC